MEPLNKPIVGYFGHPLLFMVPDSPDTRDNFWRSFQGMARGRAVAFAVSDPFLQMQYEYQAGPETAIYGKNNMKMEWVTAERLSKR